MRKLGKANSGKWVFRARYLTQVFLTRMRGTTEWKVNGEKGTCTKEGETKKKNTKPWFTKKLRCVVSMDTSHRKNRKGEKKKGREINEKSEFAQVRVQERKVADRGRPTNKKGVL